MMPPYSDCVQYCIQGKNNNEGEKAEQLVVGLVEIWSKERGNHSAPLGEC